MTTMNDFQNIGLNKNTSIILEALTNGGEQKATSLIKSTGKHRQLVYEALRELTEMGVVKRTLKNNVSHFRVVTLDPILHHIEARYQSAVSLTKLVRESRKPQESSVTFFEGIEGINSFTEYVLKTSQPLCVLGGNAQFRKLFPEIFDLWNEKRMQKKMRFRALVPTTLDKNLYEDVPGVKIRTVDTPISSSVMWVFGDHVAHILWGSRNSSEVILINSHILAKQQQSFFDSMWKQSK